MFFFPGISVCPSAGCCVVAGHPCHTVAPTIHTKHTLKTELIKCRPPGVAEMERKRSQDALMSAGRTWRTDSTTKNRFRWTERGNTALKMRESVKQTTFHRSSEMPVTNDRILRHRHALLKTVYSNRSCSVGLNMYQVLTGGSPKID